MVKHGDPHVQALFARLRDKTARVAVIGLGHAGLPLACALAESGYDVLGFDLDERTRAMIAQGRSPTADVPDRLLQQVQGKLTVANLLEAAHDCDVSVICVPTPMADQSPDLSAVTEVVTHLAKVIPAHHLLILCSTTFPGTTYELLRPILEDEGHRIGEDVFLAYSPERIDPGNVRFTVTNTPRLVAGMTEICTWLATTIFHQVTPHVVPVSSPAVAEIAKLLENTYRFVNIALANEFAVTCHELGLDVWEVIEAAGTKPYGFAPFWPGPGVGGHCIPIDPEYLMWNARRHGTVLRVVEAARDVNIAMPDVVVQRISDLLSAQGSSIGDARILVLGVAYKPGTSDTRESAAIAVIQRLQRVACSVVFHDPYVERVDTADVHLSGITDLDAEVACADIVVVLTDHAQYDWRHIEGEARLIFDARGALRRLRSPKVISL